jgi:tetratricopeptide (TPR) repeat protein
MAEEFDEDAASAPSGGTGGANPAALDAAIAGPSATTEEARDFLRRQSVLTDLQSRILHEQHAFELSHLRWRRFNDQMKGALQMMIVALGLLILVGIAAAVWDASQADGIVVDTFSVPVQFAQAGMTGDVIADDLTNRVAAVRDFANGHSIARSKGVRNGRAEEIKVEIPDTGVSFAEVSRYLRAWLGHERHLSGNVRIADDRKIALTVVLDDAGATTLVGKSGDLDKLEQLAAEHVFQNVDPSNYVLYLYGKRRPAEAVTAVQYLIQVADSPGMLSDGYALWGNWTRNYAGDLPLSLKRSRIAADADPKAAPPHLEMMGDYLAMGREEDALREARQIPDFKQEEQYAWRDGPGFGQVVEIARQEIHVAAGDFKDAETDGCGLCSRPETLLGQAEYAAREHDIARSRAMISAAGAMDQVDPARVNRASYFLDAASGNWQLAVAAAQRYAATATERNPRLQHIEMLTAITPLLAVALAHTGEHNHAHAEIDATPGDCVICETARGEIDGLEGNIARAAWWFAHADRDAPSSPFADADWGAMLLHQGDYDGAIAKFSAAHKKGSRFADPIEMWGEALMQENRSDLALAKFDEANKYAPNWGRLHLKWGESLIWSGDKAGARKQFDIASGLDLAPRERSELLRMRGTHG